MNWQNVFEQAVSEAMEANDKTEVGDVTEEEPVGSKPDKTRETQKMADRVARQFIKSYFPQA